jgi:hypothetical protein
MTSSLPKLLLGFADTFEFELLVRLILVRWNHPHADDDEYNNSLLESALEVLRSADDGQQHIDSVPPQEMNLVAAMWYVESVTDQVSVDETHEDRAGRRAWMDSVRRSLPSCFCSSSDLTP